MKTYLIIWFGQLVSRIGTAMTRFALIVWAYEQAGEGGNPATAVALIGFFAFLPLITISPLAGVWVDRLPRRTVMLLADGGAGLMTLSLLALHGVGELALWHLYVAEFLTGVFETFQAPAYTAASTLLLPKEHYARGSGLRALAQNGAQVLAPILAGVLFYAGGLAGVMLADLATFSVALATLLSVSIPEVTRNDRASRAATGGFFSELWFGFRYVWQRPGLAGMTFAFTGMNFIATLTYFSLLPVMILARSGGNELALAAVQTALGLGGVAGAILVSLWGGPRRRIHGVLLCAALSFLLGDLVLAVGRAVPFWVIGVAVGALFVPIIGASNDSIWQEKVHPAWQGRVFTAKNTLGQALVPLGYLLAGGLADHWFEPAMQVGGSLAGSFGWLVGAGPGAGIALMFVATSLAGAAFTLGFYLIPAVRNVEETPADTELEVAPQPVVAPA
ncbi:MAG: MFS transporter [Chloroflexi bacterium]|nr:MAG: MFS transporter [Chloroflexota bacterium]